MPSQMITPTPGMAAPVHPRYRTHSVLLQSGAIHKIRDATPGFLNMRYANDPAPRVRQYLEFKLEGS